MTSIAKLLNVLFWTLVGGAFLIAFLMAFTLIGETRIDACAAVGLAALSALVNTFIPGSEPDDTAEVTS